MKSIIISIIFCFTVALSNAQEWVPSNGISDKIVRTIISYNADTLLAGVDEDGIYISYDNGDNWSQFALNGYSVYSLVKIDTIIIAGTYGNDIHKSTLTNPNWTIIPMDDLIINTLALHNDTLFACTYGDSGPGAVYFSTDIAETWSHFVNASPYVFLDIDFSPQGRVFVTTPYGSYYSDNQSPWIQTSGYGSTVRTVNYLGNDSVIYGTDFGVFLSTDNGISMQQLDWYNMSKVYHLDDTIYVSTTDPSLYYTSQIGSNWVNMNFDEYALVMIKSGERLVAGTENGVFIFPGTSTQVFHSATLPKDNIFPNPVSDILIIENFDNNHYKIEIFNIDGQLELKEFDNIKINVTNLKSGLYFYKISSDKKYYTGKFIKI